MPQFSNDAIFQTTKIGFMRFNTKSLERPGQMDFLFGLKTNVRIPRQ